MASSGDLMRNGKSGGGEGGRKKIILAYYTRIREKSLLFSSIDLLSRGLRDGYLHRIFGLPGKFFFSFLNFSLYIYCKENERQREKYRKTCTEKCLYFAFLARLPLVSKIYLLIDLSFTISILIIVVFDPNLPEFTFPYRYKFWSRG